MLRYGPSRLVHATDRIREPCAAGYSGVGSPFDSCAFGVKKDFGLIEGPSLVVDNTRPFRTQSGGHIYLTRCKPAAVRQPRGLEELLVLREQGVLGQRWRVLVRPPLVDVEYVPRDILPQ